MQDLTQNSLESAQVVKQNIQPEAVQIPPQQITEVIYGSFLKRFLALIIDFIIVMIVSLIVIQIPFSFTNTIINSSVSTENSSALATTSATSLASSLARLAVQLSYNMGFLLAKGATPGKMALGLLVTDTEYKRLTFSKALIRESVGRFIAGLILGVGYLWVIWDDKKQGWHDKIANTLVIEKKSLSQQ